jgi:hypothetical protein
VLSSPTTAGDGEGAAAVAAGPGSTVTGGADWAEDGEGAATVADTRTVAVAGAVEAAAGLAVAVATDSRDAAGPVESAAGTAMASASNPSRATIGANPKRRPRGSRSRQLGQNPDTGVVT